MGQHEYELKSLADDQLLSGLASIVQRRNQITAEFLAYLAELDERQLFLDLGYSSLFEYCVEKLGLCESTAGRHIAAARVCRNHPEVFAMVARGALHASALSLLRKHLTAENADELLRLCSHQTARKVEELLAMRFPRPDVRDLIRRLPVRSDATLNVECSIQTTAETASCERAVAPDEVAAESLLRDRPADPESEPSTARVGSLLDAPPAHTPQSNVPKQRRMEPLSADRYGVHFTADGEFCALLERVRGLAGHRLPSGDLMTLIKRGLEAYERELEKERFAVGCTPRRDRRGEPASEPRTNAPTPIAPERPQPPLHSKRFLNPGRRRRCSAGVRRAVFLRDGKQCTYVSPDGRRCCVRRHLELDHIEPVAVGGEDTAENLRLRCRAHNQHYARQFFGTSRVSAAIRESRRRRARGVRTAFKGQAAKSQSPPSMPEPNTKRRIQIRSRAIRG